MKTVLVVDGVCPRGLAVIRYLSSTGEYHILVFTKDTTSAVAKAVSSVPSVTLLLNRADTGYDLQTFTAAAQRCPSILICSTAANSEGREGVQWGARLVQAAASAGAKHVVYLSMERERKHYSTDSTLLLVARCREATLTAFNRLHPQPEQNAAGMGNHPLAYH